MSVGRLCNLVGRMLIDCRSDLHFCRSDVPISRKNLHIIVGQIYNFCRSDVNFLFLILFSLGQFPQHPNIKLKFEH